MAGAVKAVLFDLDNTLLDRDRTFQAWARWFARDRLGLQTDPEADEAVALLTRLDANGHAPKDAMFRAVIGRYPFVAEDVDALVAAFREQLLAQVSVPDEGTARLLEALGQVGLPWGIVTNGSRSQLRKVRKLGLEAVASCVVVSELLGVRKPAPEIFRAAATQLGIAPPDILFVGDHPEADIVGAANAHMQTAWLRRAREWPAHLAACPPHYTIDALPDLLWVAGDRG